MKASSHIHRHYNVLQWQTPSDELIHCSFTGDSISKTKASKFNMAEVPPVQATAYIPLGSDLETRSETDGQQPTDDRQETNAELAPDGAENNPANSARNHDLLEEEEGGIEPMVNLMENEGAGYLMEEMMGGDGEGGNGAAGLDYDNFFDAEEAEKCMMPTIKPFPGQSDDMESFWF